MASLTGRRGGGRKGEEEEEEEKEEEGGGRRRGRSGGRAAIPMRVDPGYLVDPGLRLKLTLDRSRLARGQGRTCRYMSSTVSVDVDIDEAVVSPDLLDLLYVPRSRTGKGPHTLMLSTVAALVSMGQIKIGLGRNGGGLYLTEAEGNGVALYCS